MVLGANHNAGETEALEYGHGCDIWSEGRIIMQVKQRHWNMVMAGTYGLRDKS